MQNKISVCIKDEEDILIDAKSAEEISHISELIIQKYEKPLVLKLIKEKFPYISNLQKNYIKNHIKNYNTDEDFGYEARKKLISDCIYKYMTESRQKLYVESFVFFRLKKYEGLLEELVERLFDDFMLEKEYEEFIGLLKYFVNLNDDRPESINLAVRGSGIYEIFDENGENITKKCLSEFISEEPDANGVSFDDLLISVLITLAPEKIFISGRENITNSELFKTINKVFEGNIFYTENMSTEQKNTLL